MYQQLHIFYLMNFLLLSICVLLTTKLSLSSKTGIPKLWPVGHKGPLRSFIWPEGVFLPLPVLLSSRLFLAFSAHVWDVSCTL